MEDIIKKIAADVEAESAALVKQARSDADKRIAKAKADIERDAESALERARRRAEAVQRQAENQAKTANRREELLSRQAAIDEVFADVRKKLLGLSAKETQSLVDTLIKKYGKSGDTVVVSKADSKKIVAPKGFKLQASDKFEGGIVLENPNYERSLTLDELLASLRDGIELEVAKKLFS